MILSCSVLTIRASIRVISGVSKQIVILKNLTLLVRMQMVHGTTSRVLLVNLHLSVLRSIMVLVILSSKIWMAVARLTVEKEPLMIMVT